MIRIIYGKKGSGKTKRILEEANASVETAKGHNVFITDTSRFIYDLKHQLRYVNAKDYGIESPRGLRAFIDGMIAGNSDIETVFIDGAARISNVPVSEMKDFYEDLEKVGEKFGIKFVLTVSEAEEDLPDFVAKFKE